LLLVVEIQPAFVFSDEIQPAWCFVVVSDLLLLSSEILLALVFCSEIRSTIGVLRQDPSSLDVLQWVPIGTCCFPARFYWPWCFLARSNRLLQFSTSVEVLANFLIIFMGLYIMYSKLF
jgi:hypothetical protein